MRAKLEDVCVRGSSSLKQSDVIDKTGEYPIYGAAGYIGNVDFYHQDQPYIAVVKMEQVLVELLCIQQSLR